MNDRVAMLATVMWLSLAGAPVAAEAGQGDAEAGRQAFAVCGACHTVTPGGPALIGPNLWGVVGRNVGSKPGFDYSAELKAVGGSWTPEQLDRFLASPAAFAPGTRMGYVGVADPVERAALIAYLATLHEGGATVAATVQPDFGPDWPAGPGQAETGLLCNACHSLAIVKQQRLSRDVWDKLLDWMVEEQGMAEQTPERRLLILDYLAAHFGAP
jgi:cytochrome c